MFRTHALELKIPPALVFLAFGGAMYLLAAFLPVGQFDFFGRELLWQVLAGLGILVGLISVGQFLRRGTTLDPFRPEATGALVTGGVFRFSRNPMYLALLLVLLAWGLWLGNAFNAVTAGLFVAYMNRFQIRPEERILEDRFGGAYRQYGQAVRRWF
ncbi:isoprenylcysteine carboxylmethyltransferase family protein [Robiginitalea sp. M366]|uniref:methyltransferase family protein n=1 Tax=Robiginitalea aestuariiviva TaxID=3036903 RepID=UPI00240E3847|nr:isoprenylcysteine carboxylmethyltransferase family protein [Robiginitalea aestuariiviva]MDG1573510.1 isoprenylcysteine carboxylmethyltransferase family protein [Robiginitalea aestuariiviva]